MIAAVYRRFGPPEVVTAQEVPPPRPRDHEILVRVCAATVGVVDGLARRGAPWYARVSFGLGRPRFPVLGSDFAGQVAAAGPAVTRFAVGDQVFGTTAPRFGAHAEYICLSEHAAVAPKPAGVTYAEAAALADTTALCLLRDKAHLRPGQAVLVNGASGAVGAHGGHRGALPAGADRRRLPARRRGPQEGQRHRHDGGTSGSWTVTPWARGHIPQVTVHNDGHRRGDRRAQWPLATT